MKHILLYKNYGQLGNRLLTFSNLLALSINKKWCIYNLSFKEYAQYFDYFSEQNIPMWTPSKNKFLISIILNNTSINSALEFCLSNGNFLNILRYFNLLFEADDCHEIQQNEIENSTTLVKNPFVVWTAWNLKFNDLRETYRHHIKDIFKPNRFISNKISDLFKSLPANSYIVGIHMRRGDYEFFLNGMYFFSLQEYKELMNRLIKLLHHKKVHFLIASNEVVPDSLVQGLSATILNGNEIEDLYCLASCNMIAGPPSSFTEWAAFYGGIKKYDFLGTLPLSIF